VDDVANKIYTALDDVRTKKEGLIYCAYLELLARAFAVRCGDDGRVDVDEAMRLEEVVRGVGELVAHARDGADGIGARPQVRDAA